MVKRVVIAIRVKKIGGCLVKKKDNANAQLEQFRPDYLTLACAADGTFHEHFTDSSLLSPNREKIEARRASGERQSREGIKFTHFLACRI